MPYLSLTYLIQGHIIKDLQGAYGNKDMDTDMALCQHMREKVSTHTRFPADRLFMSGQLRKVLANFTLTSFVSLLTLSVPGATLRVKK